MPICANSANIDSTIAQIPTSNLSVPGWRGCAWSTNSAQGGVILGRKKYKLLDIIAQEEKERTRDENLDAALRKKHNIDDSKSNSHPIPLLHDQVISSSPHVAAHPNGPHHDHLRHHQPSNIFHPSPTATIRQKQNQPQSQKSSTPNLDLDLDAQRINATRLAEVSRKADIIIRAWETMYAATHAGDGIKGSKGVMNKWAFVDAALLNVRNGYRPYADRVEGNLSRSSKSKGGLFTSMEG